MYDPGVDALARYPEVTIRHRDLAGIPGAVCRRRKVILVERNMSRAERRCTLAHEIAHLDLEHGAPVNERSEERAADVLAAERLMALTDLAAALRWALSFEELAEELDVTTHMARVRILALSIEEKAWLERHVNGDDMRDIA